jgi:hypothetical protein
MAVRNSLDTQILRDISVLHAYREGRLEFSESLVEASTDKSEKVVALLRSEPMHQLAEFYYLLYGFKITSTDDFDALIERHNNHISLLLDDAPKMARLGLSKERVLSAIFDGETRPRVLKMWSEQPGAIDQSSLARFLIAVMSDETARKVLLAAEKAGFLIRERSVYRLVLVRSTGLMEEIYGRCLRNVRLSIERSGQAETIQDAELLRKNGQHKQTCSREDV